MKNPPAKPCRPAKPIEPSKTFTRRDVISLGNIELGKTTLLKICEQITQLLNDNHLSHETRIWLSNDNYDSYHDYCDGSVSDLRISYEKETLVENANYESDVKRYEKDMKKFHVACDKYDAAMNVYSKVMEEYETQKALEDEKNKKSQIAILEKKLAKLKSSL